MSIGAVIDGILGHQIGGCDRTLATVGGTVAGGVVGNNVGRKYGDEANDTHDVQHRASWAWTQNPAYWDVTYLFRGQQHHMQLAKPPGATVTVNTRGEPRA